MRLLQADDEDDVLARAVKVLDQVACSVSEGSEVHLHHRDGSRERLA